MAGFGVPPFLFRHSIVLAFVTFGTFEFRDIAEVQRMLKCPVAFVTNGALPSVSVAEVDGMLKYSARRIEGLSLE